MPKSSYTQVARLTGIMDLLLNMETQVSLLARRYGTSSRTIYRDLEVLRELGCPPRTALCQYKPTMSCHSNV